MNKTAILLCLIAPLALAALSCHSKITSPTPEIIGYHDTPRLPWCGYLKHDPNRPLPPYVDPGPAVKSAAPPADAVILFDGKNLSQWQPAEWKIVSGSIQAGPGDLVSRQAFGNCQLHLEFLIPEDPKGAFVDRGNSGVLLMGLYEIQIFDSYPSHKQQIYPDGQCAAVYGETPPLVNVCRPPGQWQTYDILFTRPVFKDDKLVRPAAVTMFHNGVLVHLNTLIHGPMGYREILNYKPQSAELPLELQGHKSPVRFRNIWIRPLDNRDNEE